MEQSRESAINLRCYPSEKRGVALLAYHEGVSVSEFIRICIREAAKNRGYDSVLFSGLLDSISLTEVFKVDEAAG